MTRYLFRRLATAIPVIWAISIATFLLNQCTPIDIVQQLQPQATLAEQNETTREENYRAAAAAWGLDLPVFYFTITSQAFPDTFHRIVLPEKKEWLATLTTQSGNWPAVQHYADALYHYMRQSEQLPDTLNKIPLRLRLNALRNTYILDEIPGRLDSLVAVVQAMPTASVPSLEIERLQSSVKQLVVNRATYRLWLPKCIWHGCNNQYHRWCAGFLSGKLGVSLQNRMAVAPQLARRMWRTLFIQGVALLLAFVLAVPMGLWAARHAGTRREQWLRQFLMALYAMPIFWLGSLMIIFLATSGLGWRIFSVGTRTEDMNLATWSWVSNNLDRLILPILTLSLHALAAIFLQMRGAALEVSKQLFIRTARAKGLTDRIIFTRHIFRNALFPLITLLGGLLPALFAGSVVVEWVFAVHGMGMKLLEAFVSRDYPMLMAITMLIAVLTVTGQLLADILYAWADPRVRFDTDAAKT